MPLPIVGDSLLLPVKQTYDKEKSLAASDPLRASRSAKSDNENRGNRTFGERLVFSYALGKELAHVNLEFMAESD